MKLFLTSAGICTDNLAHTFEELVGLPSKDIIIAFIPTAANVEEGDKEWLISDYANLKKRNYSVDIVDISAIPESVWLPRIKAANVLFFGGGNTFHLMHWVEKSGLQRILADLLKTRVYAGISAGSCVAGPTIYNSVQNLFGEKYDLQIEKGLELVNFQVIPHLNSDYFPKIRSEYLKTAAKELTEPIYALDDTSALSINNGEVKVVSDGAWEKYN